MDLDCLAGAYRDDEAIKKAFSQKFSPDETEIDLEFFFNDGIHAVGGIKNKKLERNEGSFYAVKKDGAWQIVAAGRGVILCDDLVPFPDYPKALIETCADGKGNEMKR
jgi:hypothetical protein